jgi:hypothetical protein
MTVVAQILDVNESQSRELTAWWADLAAANDDGTCRAPGGAEPTAAGAAAVAATCDRPDGPLAPAPAWTMHDASQHPTCASANACPAYAGDLWADVLEYRAMRAQSLAGAAMTPGERARFSAIEARLRSTTDDVRRQFLRFACRYRATLELARREHVAAVVLDASAGGVKLTCGRQVHEGDPVVLVLETESVAGSIALPARIIWVRDGFVGLMFAGAAQWR